MGAVRGLEARGEVPEVPEEVMLDTRLLGEVVTPLKPRSEESRHEQIWAFRREREAEISFTSQSRNHRCNNFRARTRFTHFVQDDQRCDSGVGDSKVSPIATSSASE